MKLTLRKADFRDDAASILQIDTSFRTNEIYSVVEGVDGLRLICERLPVTLVKQFPLDDLEDQNRPYDQGWVAISEGRAIGFAAASMEPWNSRLVLWHLYVDSSARGHGVGRRLVEAVLDHGREAKARHLWLETSSHNVPGVAAYRAFGFRLTGIDLTLYDGTPAEGEAALFFSRPIT
jgi:ribosomal protein S18 acetylase RimI-like enzyme